MSLATHQSANASTATLAIHLCVVQSKKLLFSMIKLILAIQIPVDRTQFALNKMELARANVCLIITEIHRNIADLNVL